MPLEEDVPEILSSFFRSVAQPPASFVGRLEECGFSIFSSMSTKNTWVVVANIFFSILSWGNGPI